MQTQTIERAPCLPNITFIQEMHGGWLPCHMDDILFSNMVPFMDYHEEVEGSHFGNSYRIWFNNKAEYAGPLYRQDMDADTWELWEGSE